MAARLGILPEEASRLTPSELKELWEGYVWRHSRMIEVIAKVATMLLQVQGAEVEYPQIVGGIPGYDQEYEKEMRRIAPPPKTMRRKR